MSQPQPVTKRRVMGRMDLAATDSANTTPTARSRVARVAHGTSSPSTSMSRSATSTGRAKVDMSTLGSPSSAVSSPTMSPPMQRNPTFTAPGLASTLTAKASMLQSPPIRLSSSSTGYHSRAGSTVGSSSTLNFSTSPDVRGDTLADTSFVSVRRTRPTNRSTDLTAAQASSLPSSPALASHPSDHPFAGSPSLSKPGVFRTPQTGQSLRAKLSSSTTRTTAILQPPRQQDLQQLSRSLLRSRTPSPSRNEADRPGEKRWGQLAPPFESPGAIGPFSPSLTSSPVPVLSSPKLKRRRSFASTASSVTQDSSSQAGSEVKSAVSMTTGRSHARTNSAYQRPAIPSSMVNQLSLGGGASHLAQPNSSTATSSPTLVKEMLPLSPTSEIKNLPPFEQAEAEEARVNRKLLDLEITNKSLLAINAGLEVTKLKQAKEIRELKRRLRESRGFTLAPTELQAPLQVDSPIEDDDLDFSEDEALDDDLGLEAAHSKCKNLIDQMVNRARAAILYQYVLEPTAGSKVLHPAEIEQLQQEKDAEAASNADDTQDADQTGDRTDISTAETKNDGSTSTIGSKPALTAVDRFPDSSQQERFGLSHPTSTVQSTPEISIDSSFTSEDTSISADQSPSLDSCSDRLSPDLESKMAKITADVSID